MRKIVSKNPYTGELRETVKFLTNQELDVKIKRAQQGYEIHRKRTIQQRARLIARLGQVFQEHHKIASEAITYEMGKTITEAEMEVSKTIRFCKYYSENYQPILPQEVNAGAKKHAFVKYFPTGILYFLVPFNFPLYLSLKGGLPNLLLGNVIMARFADSCPNVGRVVEDIMIKAGLNNGQFQNVYTTYDQIDQIFKYDSVSGVSFTGSTAVGGIIAAKAGQYLKRSVMELGGNDPFVVLNDANLDLAVSQAVRGRCFNAGQVCFSPKRFIVHSSLYDQFKSKLIEGLSKVKYGDPMDRDTKMGPLARQDLHDNLSKQLTKLPKSYKISYQRSEMKKPFFPITVIEGSDQVWDEQLFGPVYQLFKVENDEHAIKLANTGSYGLGASVFSASRGEQVMDEIRCGLGFVNQIPKSETSFPSGGVAKSGYGRECGIDGYRQFANVKIHYVN